MGQQQLLLLILGTIVIGISIRVGLRMADTQNMQQNRDQLALQAQQIYALAEQYATKSTRQAGGAGTYTSFKLSKGMTQSVAGTFTATVSGTTGLTIIGTGNVKGNNGTSPVTVTTTITGRKITKTIFSN
jgi:hypothetical protein